MVVNEGMVELLMVDRLTDGETYHFKEAMAVNRRSCVICLMKIPDGGDLSTDRNLD